MPIRIIAILFLIVAIAVPTPASALQHYVKDVLKWMEKECSKKPNGKDCRQACGNLGATADKWDVALNEKNRCIELTCGKDNDKTEKRENYWGDKVEVKTSCGILCDNISDRHPLCAQEKIEKYCEGKGKDESKCAKYCDRSGNKNSLCPNFSSKKSSSLVKKPVNTVKSEQQEEKVLPVSEKTEVKTETVPDVTITTNLSSPIESTQSTPNFIEKMKGLWKRIWN